MSNSLDSYCQHQLMLLHHQQVHRPRYVRHTAQRVRLQINDRAFINFSSNDYLGLANHPTLISAMEFASKIAGVGSGASQLICGHHIWHTELEQAIAAFMGYPKALLFSSGYMANAAIQTVLPQKQDILFHDKRNHASMIDAGRLATATVRRYQHSDMQQLQHFLQQTAAGKRRFIVSDGVFSMEGDVACYSLLYQFAELPQTTLVIDDAHGFGVFGKQGRGSWSNDTLHRPDIVMATFGKCLGCFGAFVVSTAPVIDYLMQRARTYIYTTAMPAALAYTALTALQVMQQEVWRREKLWENITYFCQQAVTHGVMTTAIASPIQPIIVGDIITAVRIADALQKAGIFVTAIRPPTVATSACRLRLTLSCQHSREDIDICIKVLAAAMQSCTQG